MVGFVGSSLSTQSTFIDTLKIDLRERNLGGVILMGGNGNLVNPQQMKNLTDSLKLFSSLPLLISTDQEGGRVARLNANNGFATTYTALKLGTQINHEDTTRKQSSLMAGWLKLVGINTNFAPVVDVNVNPTSPAIGNLERSFSNDTTVVYNHSKWFIDEFKKKNIISTLKHFPGHGSATTDSHLGFTNITSTWRSFELYPFKQLIADNVIDVVMTGHLFNSKIDSLYPATLSNKAINGLLKQQIGFNGVVVSDDMFMKAISNNYTFDQSVELAVNAGVDVLLYVSNLMTTPDKSSVVRKIIDLIEKKVQTGFIAESRINDAYSRILNLKNKYLGASSIAELSHSDMPTSFSLNQNYPNPFNPITVIKWQAHLDGWQTLKIYDVLGNVVAALVDEYKPSGNYAVTFSGITLASGVYFYRLTLGSYSQTKKMILLK